MSQIRRKGGREGGVPQNWYTDLRRLKENTSNFLFFFFTYLVSVKVFYSWDWTPSDAHISFQLSTAMYTLQPSMSRPASKYSSLFRAYFLPKPVCRLPVSTASSNGWRRSMPKPQSYGWEYKSRPTKLSTFLSSSTSTWWPVVCQRHWFNNHL